MIKILTPLCRSAMQILTPLCSFWNKILTLLCRNTDPFVQMHFEGVVDFPMGYGNFAEGPTLTTSVLQ
jgi:hypothetical protein